MKKFKIITDSASDLPQAFDSDVEILPMTIRFGSEEYRDGISISPRQFFEKLAESDELPATSLISPGTFQEAFRKALRQCEKVLVITMSSKLSGTCQSAVLAAQEFPGEVYVVDSKNVAVGEQILVLRALELLRAGEPVAAVAERLEQEREKVRTVALLDTLEYLQKGGRISKSVAFFGSALSIKPVVMVKDGEVALVGKARGSRNGNLCLMRQIEDTAGVDFTRPLRIGYTGLTDAPLQKYMEDSRKLWNGHGEQIVTVAIGPTIGTHVGPGAVAVAFFEL